MRLGSEEMCTCIAHKIYNRILARGIFVKNDVAYTTDTDKISVRKMQFTVTNRRPKFTKKEKDKAKTEIERQLFEVFRKND